MSSVLHPVGPEPVQTYWVRRALLLLAAIVALVLAIVVLVNLSRANSANASAPGGAPAVVPAQASTPASASAPDEASAPTSSLATPGPARTPSATTGRADSATRPGSTAGVTANRTASLPCDPTTLRSTLTGQRAVKVDHATTFDLSLINGSAANCRVVVDSSVVELKIYSGSDRIWSSQDCAKVVPTKVAVLRSQDAVAWKMAWNGRRSAPRCQSRPEIPRPGTYLATAQFSGAQPVQFRIVLHG